MSKRGSWRLSASAETFAEHDFPDFAQEFLRRNPDYRQDHSLITRRNRRGSLTGDALARTLEKWGLVFRLRPRRRSDPGPRYLAARPGAHDDRRRNRAAGLSNTADLYRSARRRP
ncbi:transcriptional regulator domain-containing protein [Phenylobacterium haematophilum]|uniref:transcriptional regulator domain-containing protein n=1 Tax=Phenylobacterium haematophilum TaxID=98513 RepID=UPI001C849ED9